MRPGLVLVMNKSMGHSPVSQLALFNIHGLLFTTIESSIYRPEGRAQVRHQWNQCSISVVTRLAQRDLRPA